MTPGLIETQPWVLPVIARVRHRLVLGEGHEELKVLDRMSNTELILLAARELETA